MLLRRGDRGPAVADLRDALTSLQLLPGLNGSDRTQVEFDDGVDRAIRDFQQRRGLIADGIVGPVTARSLTDARWTLGARILSHTLSAPMTGDDVMALQTRLAEMGYNTGRPDGIFGPLTDQSVRDFQRHRGLADDGVFGPQTYKELNRIGRMVTGGRPQYLREYQLVRQAGPRLHGKRIVLDPAHGADDPGWTSGGVIGLFTAAIVLGVVWGRWEWRVTDPLVDLRLMRQRAVWTTNVVTFAIGFAMFGSFVLIPQLVQTPPVAGYGFAASVTASGLFLLPSSLVMLVAAPLSGRLSTRHGSKLPLALGSVFASAGYFWLAAMHGARIDIYIGSLLLGLGIGLAFAATANLMVEAVPQEVTGVASAINAIMRTVGGAIGAQISAAIVSADLVLGGRFPAESGFVTAFAMSGVGALVALGVTFLIPSRERARAGRPAEVPA